MDEYNILNSVKPKYFKTTYPYSLVDPEKITFTQKKIKLLVKSTTADGKKTGGKEVNVVVFYG